MKEQSPGRFEWFQRLLPARNKLVQEENMADFYKHRGFMLMSQNPAVLKEAVETYRELWDQNCKKSQLVAMCSDMKVGYNDFWYASVFPCGSRETGLVFVAETIVHEKFEEYLNKVFPEVSWIRFQFGPREASILGHTGV